MQVESLKETTNDVLNDLKTWCTLTLSTFSSIICLSVVPIFILFKKRVKKHLDIYDLIVSVES
jgi:hypothetical protein